jgi:hypothetical protein
MWKLMLTESPKYLWFLEDVLRTIRTLGVQ